mmetsp:Transcript_146324/g.469415  ORF Transcript_146324/g.469415 Transcript_146324/m.469415 type:complete len:227 (+) Transcript_146324:299-979(+)
MHALTYDAALGPWMRAFAGSVRQAVGSLPFEDAPLDSSSDFLRSSHGVLRKWLVLKHHRSPDWVYTADWGVPTVVTQLHLLTLPQQVEILSNARALISIEGAAFINQLFMAVPALLLVLHVCEIKCWHSTVAQYLGHATLEWGVCEPKHWTVRPADGPSRSSTVAAAQLLLAGGYEAQKRKMAWRCALIGLDVSSSACARPKMTWVRPRENFESSGGFVVPRFPAG